MRFRSGAVANGPRMVALFVAMSLTAVFGCGVKAPPRPPTKEAPPPAATAQGVRR